MKRLTGCCLAKVLFATILGAVEAGVKEANKREGEVEVKDKRWEERRMRNKAVPR